MKQGFAKFSLQCPIKRAAEAPQVAQWSRICLPTQDMQDMQFLGWEDPLEKEIATPRTEKTGRLHPWGHKESDMIQHKRKIDFFFFLEKCRLEGHLEIQMALHSLSDQHFNRKMYGIDNPI